MKYAKRKNIKTLEETTPILAHYVMHITREEIFLFSLEESVL